jgi:hypothetical protein
MNRTNLRNYLEGLIKEALSAKSGDNIAMSQLREAESGEDTQQIASGKVTVDTIIDKLNFIRSGRSFKDAGIKSNLAKYLDGLDDAEKTALLAFLKGISQIVTAEISPEQAIEPADYPAKVEMEKQAKNKITIKPTILKSGGAPSKEDTAGPAPIQPKK